MVGHTFSDLLPTYHKDISRYKLSPTKPYFLVGHNEVLTSRLALSFTLFSTSKVLNSAMKSFDGSMFTRLARQWDSRKHGWSCKWSEETEIGNVFSAAQNLEQVEGAMPLLKLQYFRCELMECWDLGSHSRHDITSPPSFRKLLSAYSKNSTANIHSAAIMGKRRATIFLEHIWFKSHACVSGCPRLGKSSRFAFAR